MHQNHRPCGQACSTNARASSLGRIIVHKHIDDDSYSPIDEATLLVDALCETYSNSRAYNDIAILADARVGWKTAALKLRLCNRRNGLRNGC